MENSSNKHTLQKSSFPLSASGIDSASELITAYLRGFGVKSRDAIRLRLSVEEILLKWHESEGLDGKFDVELQRRHGRISLTVSCKGASCDPLVIGDSDKEAFGTGALGRSILENLALSPSWQYQNGVNIISVNRKLQKHISQFAMVSLAVLLAFILGEIFRFLPESWGGIVLENLIDPLFNTFLALLSCIVGPLMFLSMVWGIYNIGDARQIGVIGKRLFGRFITVCFLFGIICMTAAVLLFNVQIGGGNGGEGIFKSLVEMVLDIVPKNIVSPFADGNTLQILFMGIVVGITMILLRNRMQVMSLVVDQSNAIVQAIISAISALVPYFIFLSVFKLVLEGTFAKSATGLFIVILLSTVLTVALLIFETISMLTVGLKPVDVMRKLGSILLIAVSTASSAASFPSMMECSEKRLGMNTKFVNFALPLGNVLCKPNMINIFILVSLFAAKLCGVPITVGTLVLCLINSVVLSMAAPPIPGGAVSCFTLLFMQMGIPLEMLTIAVAANVVLDFTTTAGDMFGLVTELTRSAKKLKMIDYNIMKQK